MRTYKVALTVANGLRDERVNVVFKTSAKTRNGLLNAMAKAIVSELATDVFEVNGLISREGVSRDYYLSAWHNEGRLSANESAMLRDKVSNALFDMRY